MIVKPELPDGGAYPSLPHYVFGEFAERYPCLAAYWSASQWPDGTPKKPGRPGIGIWNGKLSAQFQLVGTGLMVRAEIPDPILFWDALEALLSTVPVPWQPDPFLAADELKEVKKPRKKGS